jgi:hypothetical protein
MEAGRLAFADYQAAELARQLGPSRDDLPATEAALLERSIKQSCKKAWKEGELPGEQGKGAYLARYPGGSAWPGA